MTQWVDPGEAPHAAREDAIAQFMTHVATCGDESLTFCEEVKRQKQARAEATT